MTPDQILEFAQFPQFRRLVAQLVNVPALREETAFCIRTMIELRDMLEETNER